MDALLIPSFTVVPSDVPSAVRLALFGAEFPTGELSDLPSAHDVLSVSDDFDSSRCLSGTLLREPLTDPSTRWQFLFSPDGSTNRLILRCSSQFVAQSLSVAGPGQRVCIAFDSDGAAADVVAYTTSSPCCCSLCQAGSTRNVCGIVTASDRTGAGFELDGSMRVLVPPAQRSNLLGLRIGAVVRLLHAHTLQLPPACTLPLTSHSPPTSSYAESSQPALANSDALVLTLASGLRVTRFADITPHIKAPDQSHGIFTQLSYTPSQSIDLSWPFIPAPLMYGNHAHDRVAWLIHTAAVLKSAAHDRWKSHFDKVCDTLKKSASAYSTAVQFPWLATIAGARSAARTQLLSSGACSSVVSLEWLGAALFVKLRSYAHGGFLHHEIEDCTGSVVFCEGSTRIPSHVNPSGRYDWHVLFGGRITAARANVTAQQVHYRLVADAAQDFSPRHPTLMRAEANVCDGISDESFTVVEGIVTQFHDDGFTLCENSSGCELVLKGPLHSSTALVAPCPIGSTVRARKRATVGKMGIIPYRDLSHAIEIVNVPRYSAGKLDPSTLPIHESYLASEACIARPVKCWCRIPVVHRVDIIVQHSAKLGDRRTKPKMFEVLLWCELDDGSARAPCSCTGAIARLLLFGSMDADVPPSIAQRLLNEPGGSGAKLVIQRNNFFDQHFSVQLSGFNNTIASESLLLAAIRMVRIVLSKLPRWLVVRQNSSQSETQHRHGRLGVDVIDSG